MKTNALALFVVAVLALLTGCASYDYQIVEPASLARRVADEPVVLKYEPLEYRLSRHKGRLRMTIMNPTDDRIVLRGDRSYVVDSRGESHPVHARIIGPRSFASMLLPPIPASDTVLYPGYYGPGWWGWGPYPYPGYWGGFYPDYYGPVTSYYEFYTPYDWKWDVGPARIHLGYDRGGTSFNHDFVIRREREK